MKMNCEQCEADHQARLSAVRAERDTLDYQLSEAMNVAMPALQREIAELKVALLLARDHLDPAMPRHEIVNLREVILRTIAVVEGS